MHSLKNVASTACDVVGGRDISRYFYYYFLVGVWNSSPIISDERNTHGGREAPADRVLRRANDIVKSETHRAEIRVSSFAHVVFV